MPGSPWIRITPAPRTPPGPRPLQPPLRSASALQRRPPVLRGHPSRGSPPARRNLGPALSAVASAAMPPPCCPPPPLRVVTVLAPPQQLLTQRMQDLQQALVGLGAQVSLHRMSTGSLCQQLLRLTDRHGPGLAEAIQTLEQVRSGASQLGEARITALREARLWLAGLQDLRDLLMQLDPASRLGMPPRLREDLWAQYAQESRDMLTAWLEEPTEAHLQDAVIYGSLMAPDAREHFCGRLDPSVARQIVQRQREHSLTGLDADRLMLMRLIAHPDSGAFNAIRSLFLLAQAHPMLHLHRAMGGIGTTYVDTVQALAAMPDTGVQGELFKGVVLRAGAPWVRPVGRPGRTAGGPFTVLWPMSTTLRLDQAYLGAFQQHRREYDGLLRLRRGIQAIRADWFHPPVTMAQAEALVLPGQRLRVVSQARVQGPHPSGADYLLVALERADAGPAPAGPAAQAASL